jgi:hypothetical protein
MLQEDSEVDNKQVVDLAVGQQGALALPAVVSVQHQHLPQVGLAEAALEAHLQRQHQVALVAVQDLERQRLQR